MTQEVTVPDYADDATLNQRLAEVADMGDGIGPDGLNGGKAIAYYGWFWRNVDFSRPLSFAYANGKGWDVPNWVGFCENNKWGYEEFRITAEQTAEMRRLCVAIAQNPTTENAQALFDYMQATRPTSVTGARRWQDA